MAFDATSCSSKSSGAATVVAPASEGACVIALGSFVPWAAAASYCCAAASSSNSSSISLRAYCSAITSSLSSIRTSASSNRFLYSSSSFCFSMSIMSAPEDSNYCCYSIMVLLSFIISSLRLWELVWKTMFSSWRRFLRFGLKIVSSSKMSFRVIPLFMKISISKLPSMMSPPKSRFYKLFLKMFSSIVLTEIRR